MKKKKTSITGRYCPVAFIRMVQSLRFYPSYKCFFRKELRLCRYTYTWPWVVLCRWWIRWERETGTAQPHWSARGCGRNRGVCCVPVHWKNCAGLIWRVQQKGEKCILLAVFLYMCCIVLSTLKLKRKKRSSLKEVTWTCKINLSSSRNLVFRVCFFFFQNGNTWKTQDSLKYWGAIFKT